MEADALPVALPAPSPARNAYHGALLVMSTVIGTLAAVLTSTTFATILNLAPHGDDNWGLKCTATALRLAVLTLSLLRSEPSTPIAVLVGVARLLTGVAVELCILFAQPIYATYSGGIFKPGDATKQLALRLGRAAWLSVESLMSISLESLPGLLVLFTALALVALEKRKKPNKRWLHGYPRSIVSILAKTAKTVAVAAIFQRFKTGVLEFATSLRITSYLAALPTALFMSRQELSLFRWSIDSSLHLTLIIVGDFLSSNPAVPPIWGASGVFILGGGLLLAGITPTFGFALNATAWLAHAACHVAFDQVEGPTLGHNVHLPAAKLDVTNGGGGPYGRASSAKIMIRVGGWAKPRYWTLDKTVKALCLTAVLLAKPSWTYAAADFAAASIWELCEIVGDGVYAAVFY